jgi:hypothetical protein
MTVPARMVTRRLLAPGNPLLAPLATAALAVAAAGYIATVDPNQPGHYPTCPFLSVSGYYCPGCGSLRAVHDLIHGNPHAALARNPLTVLAAPFLLWSWIAWLYRSVTGRPVRWLAPPWLLWTLLVVVLAFWLLRNLPGFGWLGP